MKKSDELEANAVNPQYYVVKNHEEQYSIWPSYRQIPQGWKAVGVAKDKADCLSFIEEEWVDMKPLSLRKKMILLAKNVVND